MITLRRAVKDDYPEFRKMEEAAWAETGVELISLEQFESWLDIFPQGLRIACLDGKICGHIFGQICDFDPTNKNEGRNWHEITDNGFCKKTHCQNGSTLYVVSVSASYPGAGIMLLRYSYALAKEFNKQYVAGACRLPGLTKFYPDTEHRNITKEMVEKYVKLVYNTIRKKREENQPRVFDPVLSVEMKTTKDAKCGVVIKDYLECQQSFNWSCITYIPVK